MLPVGATVCVVDPLHFYNGRVGQVQSRFTRMTVSGREATIFMVEFPTGTGTGTVSSAVDSNRLYEVEIYDE